MEARGIYWLIVALHGITPAFTKKAPDAHRTADGAAQPWRSTL